MQTKANSEAVKSAKGKSNLMAVIPPQRLEQLDVRVRQIKSEPEAIHNIAPRIAPQ